MHSGLLSGPSAKISCPMRLVWDTSSPPGPMLQCEASVDRYCGALHPTVMA